MAANRSDSSIVLDLAWKQIDKTNIGYIYGRDFPLLFDAIDSLLNSQMLNFNSKRVVKDYSNTNPHDKIYKSDFKNLYNTLIGESFNERLERIDYDRTILQIEREDDSVLPTIPVLTSTPVKGEEDIEPSFKTQYRKMRKMHDNSEEEIRYRDKIIEQLEKRESGARDKDSQIKTLYKKLESLEEDVDYRDKIIMEKENESNMKDEKLKRLQERLKLVEDEVRLYRDSDNKVVVKHNEFFNKELMQRVKEQQRAIDSLKIALAQKSKVIAKNPIIISSVSNSSSKSMTFPWRNTIYSIVVLFLLYFIFLRPRSSNFRTEPWYTNTFLEPYFYHFLEDKEIDYEYYNLAGVNFDYLQT